MSQISDIDNKKIEDSIYALVDKLNTLVVREQLNLQEELARVSSIISDATEILTENFTVLNMKIELQSRYMRDGYPDEKREQKLEELNREIDKNLTETIRSLQFEDIVQQLTTHSRNRAVNMESLFVKLMAHLNQIKEERVYNSGRFGFLLDEMQRDIEEFREALNRENPVKQKSMDEGGVELF